MRENTKIKSKAILFSIVSTLVLLMRLCVWLLSVLACTVLILAQKDRDFSCFLLFISENDPLIAYLFLHPYNLSA